MVEGVVNHEGKGVRGVEEGGCESLVYHRTRSDHLLNLAITHTWWIFIEIFVLVVIIEIHILPSTL